MTGHPTVSARRLLDVLPDAPPGVTETELIARYGVKPTTLQVGTLRWLHRQGYVMRTGRPYRYWRVKEPLS